MTVLVKERSALWPRRLATDALGGGGETRIRPFTGEGLAEVVSLTIVPARAQAGTGAVVFAVALDPEVAALAVQGDRALVDRA